jgi:sterol desaturase/sphingolipid hydroxylase (fatty acid hydroxylase superfamily)
MILVFLLPMLAFVVCFATVLARDDGRAAVRARSASDWAIDLVSLGVQGWVIPLLAATVGGRLWAPVVAPGSLPLGVLGGLVLSLVVVDFAYYLNHRLLHRWWAAHRVHHGAPAMDVWISARNTVWTPLFIVYVWANSLFGWWLDAPEGYLLGVAITSSLDLWRHSPLQLNIPGLITPRHHAWHHSDRHDVNFGANFSIWDRLFGTYYDPGVAPDRVGVGVGLAWWRQLVWPFGAS